ncbi:glucose-1-phosphate cytidylyltransferase [Verrucomicrobiales bacterium]|nr:glucose-1-phosphate cytidylyltransferase [Verrucomicrobiales bacterium]
MKAIILAGGLGTRLSEETSLKPKPMVEIGGKPILWHIMKMYSSHDIKEFIICCGYKGYMIKEYFSNYFLHMSDITFDFSSNTTEVHSKRVEDWKVTLINTGESSMTGGRLLRVRDYVKEDDAFCFTYGDGIGDNDITQSIEFHKRHGKLATMTTCYPPGRFGAIAIKDNKVLSFQEKPKGDGAMVNAGFFVLSPKVFDYLEGDNTIWEKEPLENLALQGELMAFNHQGFWQPMDTLVDKIKLENLWKSDMSPWKVW